MREWALARDTTVFVCWQWLAMVMAAKHSIMTLWKLKKSKGMDTSNWRIFINPLAPPSTKYYSVPCQYFRMFESEKEGKCDYSNHGLSSSNEEGKKIVSLLLHVYIYVSIRTCMDRHYRESSISDILRATSAETTKQERLSWLTPCCIRFGIYRRIIHTCTYIHTYLIQHAWYPVSQAGP